MLMMTSILMRMGAAIALYHMLRVKSGPGLRFQWKFKVVQSRAQDGPSGLSPSDPPQVGEVDIGWTLCKSGCKVCRNVACHHCCRDFTAPRASAAK